MATAAFIQCRVTSETKARVRALAERERISESALVRQLLATVIRTSSGGGSSGSANPRHANRNARLSIRLPADDYLLLGNRAESRGMAPATYVSVLVRAHLRNLVPLPKEELLALRRSIAELMAVGRNLNQIARLMNEGRASSGPGRDELRALLKVAEGLRDHFRSLLKANEQSWKEGHAPTTD